MHFVDANKYNNKYEIIFYSSGPSTKVNWFDGNVYGKFILYQFYSEDDKLFIKIRMIKKTFPQTVKSIYKTRFLGTCYVSRILGTPAAGSKLFA